VRFFPLTTRFSISANHCGVVFQHMLRVLVIRVLHIIAQSVRMISVFNFSDFSPACGMGREAARFSDFRHVWTAVFSLYGKGGECNAATVNCNTAAICGLIWIELLVFVGS